MLVDRSLFERGLRGLSRKIDKKGPDGLRHAEVEYGSNSCWKGAMKWSRRYWP